MPNLLAELAKVRTEEDVKDAYIKALGLKKYNKGLVDIQTEEIWFEAKGPATPPVQMFAQLLFYIRWARKHGEKIPPFLCVIDREKAAIMETERALPILLDKSIPWPKSASAVGKDTVAGVAPHIEAHFVVYKIETHEKEFLGAVKAAVKAGRLIRTPITPDNLRQVFDKWVAMIGAELEGVDPTDYALLFFADIMHDGKKAAMENLPARLLHEGDRPVFLLNGQAFELSSDRGYRNFWAIYHRPPEANYRANLLERRDSLLPLNERAFKGAYYTPLHIVDESYTLLSSLLGANWQSNYIVWDMCCGVGNLEVKHSNHRNIFMSTLDKADIDVMTASRTCTAATKFQYDYLNDDVTSEGKVDYSITQKLPALLIKALSDFREKKAGAKKILVLINPPYGEAANTIGEAGKTDIAKTKIGANMTHLGYAARELFVQFLHRISIEIPGATVGIFSKLKYVNAPNFAIFRDTWKAKYLGGFVVHSKAFDSLKGDFPIGFLVWDTSKKTTIGRVDTYAIDKYGSRVGQKTFDSLANAPLLSAWIDRLSTDTINVPLKNAISPQDALAKVTTWKSDAIGYMLANANDMQHASTLTAIFSSVCSQGNGFYITPNNLAKVAVVFAVRRLIKPTWLSDRDQFYQPQMPLSDEFTTDCLVWMLFNGSNLTAGANELSWSNRYWSLTNHFIPFSEVEVGSTGRFESNFMHVYLSQFNLSKESTAVIDQGRNVWRAFHSTRFEKRIRDEFKLNRPDSGWYQIRRSLEADDPSFDLEGLQHAYAELGKKLAPQVFSLGFLR